jgi:hypothetical protein
MAMNVSAHAEAADHAAAVPAAWMSGSRAAVPNCRLPAACSAADTIPLAITMAKLPG